MNDETTNTGERPRDEALASLLFDLAHAMRSPLLTLLGFTDLLREPHDPETLERALAAIERSTLRLHRLVEDLVSLARLHAPPPPLAPRPLDLRALLQEILREARQTWSVEAPRFDLRVEGAPRVLCDERALRIAVGALLRNALEASGPEDAVRVALVETAEGGARITIENAGDPLPASDPALERLFSAFERGEARAGAGLGLGLTLARRNAEAIGAALELSAMPEGGARATLSLSGG